MNRHHTVFNYKGLTVEIEKGSLCYINGWLGPELSDYKQLRIILYNDYTSAYIATIVDTPKVGIENTLRYIKIMYNRMREL